MKRSEGCESLFIFPSDPAGHGTYNSFKLPKRRFLSCMSDARGSDFRFTDRLQGA